LRERHKKTVNNKEYSCPVIRIQNKVVKKVANKYFENAAKFKYLGNGKLTNQNYVPVFRLLSENVMNKAKKPVVFYGCEAWFQGRTQTEGV
jgi:hypothetical protein